MRKSLGSLVVRLGFDPKEVDRGIKQFERNLKDMSKRMESLGKTMTIGFTAPFIYGIGKAIKAYDEEAQAVKKLEVALGGTSKALLEQAAAIQKNTIYADDQVLTVQAWAAALGHSEDQILSMTTAATGLAAGLGIDLQQAMEMLHKTTVGSAGALGKMMPEIKAMTKEQLKAGEAINLVSKKFAGFAEQAAKTGAGPLKQFENQFGDLMEQFGQAALPLMQKLIEKLQALTQWFANLSPHTKDLVVNIGAFVALAGPVMIITSNIIKLTQAVIGLGVALKGVALSGKGIFAAAAVVGGAEAAAYEKFGPENIGATIGTMMVQKYARPKSSLYSGATNLILGATQSSAPGLPPVPNASNVFSGGGGGGAAKQYQSASGFHMADWNEIRAMQWSSAVPGMESLAMGGVSGTGKEGDWLTGIEERMKGIRPVIEEVKGAFVSMGDIIGTAMNSIIGDLDEGGKSFGEYALNAIKSVGMVVRAKLMELAVEALFDSTKKGGIAGLFAGIAGVTIGLGIIDGLLKNIKAPALAAGGLAYGPTMALVGDNPNSSTDPEVISPLSKLRSIMGGGGGQIVQVEARIAGDDILLTSSRAQYRGIRRGSGNVISFNQ